VKPQVVTLKLINKVISALQENWHPVAWQQKYNPGDKRKPLLVKGSLVNKTASKQ